MNSWTVKLTVTVTKILQLHYNTCDNTKHISHSFVNKSSNVMDCKIRVESWPVKWLTKLRFAQTCWMLVRPSVMNTWIHYCPQILEVAIISLCGRLYMIIVFKSGLQCTQVACSCTTCECNCGEYPQSIRTLQTLESCAIPCTSVACLNVTEVCSSTIAALMHCRFRALAARKWWPTK